MNWLWPKLRVESDSVLVRIARVIHWGMAALAAFFWVITIFALLSAGEGNVIAHLTVTFVWGSIAMLGRGVRYVVARE